MNKLAKLSLLGLLLVGMGCATTRIYPVEGGTYRLVANSAYESTARNKALSQIQEHCDKQHQGFEIINENTEYSGVNRELKAVAGILGEGYKIDRHDDYRVTMSFRCK
jgi:hypothetical protein